MINKSNFIGQFITDINNYYNFLQNLGSGSFGEIFKVQHKLTGDIRACKRMNKRKIVKKERFVLEIELLKTTDHPGIIKLFEIFEDQVYIYLIMELCEGGDFFDRPVKRVKNKKLYTEKEVASFIKQILLSISYCHAHGVCHRDIKPENILFSKPDEESRLKIIDFGLSKVMGNESNMLRSIVGTPYYMAPEVLRGEYDLKCDIWSIGVLLYILLSGRQPFFGKTDNEIMQKISSMSYTFNYPEFDNISNEAKLILKSIFRDAKTRPTAIDLLQTSWVNDLAPTSINKILDINLNTCYTYGKLNSIHKSVVCFVAFRLSDSDAKELAEIFKSYDNNYDGVVTFKELKEGLLTVRNKLNLDLREKDIDSLFNGIDVDRNGLLNYTEFISAILNYNDKVKKTQIYDAFRNFDCNHDGILSFDELAMIVRPQTEKDLMELEMLFRQFDINEDNQLDFEEFLQNIERGYDLNKIVKDEKMLTSESVKTTSAF